MTPELPAGRHPCLVSSGLWSLSFSPFCKMGWRRPLQAFGEDAGAQPRGAFPGDLSFPCPHPGPNRPPIPGPGLPSTPAQRVCGNRRAARRLCAQVTAPLSPLNEWVAKAFPSNRASSPLPAARPHPRDALAPQFHPTTYSGNLSQRREGVKAAAACPSKCLPHPPESPRSHRGTQVFFRWRN